MRCVLVMLAMLLPGAWACSAGAASADITARINRLMEASGINQSVKQVLPGLLSSLDDTQQPPLQPQVRAAMRDAAVQGFHTAPMLEKVRARLAGGLTDKQNESYIQFSRSASGTAFNKRAVAGVSDALLDAIGRFMTAIPKAMERTKGSVGT
jgi:hypothetical protein